MKWFFNQRSYPNFTTPQGAYNQAIKHFIKIASQNDNFSPIDNWKSLGPTPGYFNSYVSGRVSSVKFNPGDVSGMTIFAAGSDGGVWKSLDGGQTWTPKTDFITSLSSGALAIGQNSSGQYENIYFGTGESHAGFNFCYYGDGFYKSIDNGETWRQINDNHLPKNPTYFSRIVVRPGHPNEILAACGTNHTNISYEAGLYRSTDYGETWQNRIVPSIGLEGRVCNDVVFSPDGSKAFITGPDESSPQIYERGVGFRISTDGGATFGPPRDDIIKVLGRTHIAISSYEPYRIYILTHKVTPCSPGSCSSISLSTVLYISYDGGNSFSEGANFLAFNCNCVGGDAFQSWYDMFIYISPQNHDIVYVGLVNMWKSIDGGQTFVPITPAHNDMQNMDFNLHQANHILLATDGGVYSSTNGGTGRNWDNLNAQLTFTQFYRIASCPFNTEIIVGGSQDNGIQSKYQYSDDWRDVLGGNDGTAVVYSKLNPNLIFGGFGNYANGMAPGILRSTDAGSSFMVNFDIPNSVWDSQNDWIPPIASSVDHISFIETFYTARRISTPPNNVVIKLFATNNAGQSWLETGNGIFANESPQNLAISVSNPQVMYLSTGSYAWPYTNQKLYKSTDGGINWQEILNNSSIEVPNRYITHIEIEPSDENLVYITLSGFNSTTPGKPGHIFRSTNGGTKWEDFSGTLPDIPVNDIVIVYRGTKNFIIATDAGVLATSDGGAIWNEIGHNLPHAVVTDLEYNVFSGRVRAATFGRGVWEVLLVGAANNINYPLCLNSDESGLKIDNDLIVEKGGKLMAPYNCTIKMAEGRKIIVKDGGEIYLTGQISFASQKGKWGGIEIHDGAKGRIENCSFNNSETPIVYREGSKGVIVSNCKINKSSVVNTIPHIFSLSQNYPNPFNPITTMGYSLPKRSDITITIYDAAGRLVETLIKGEVKDAGYYTVEFDGSNLSSGIYFYVINAGDFRDSKKMILVK